jgi:hypothetical protein
MFCPKCGIPEQTTNSYCRGCGVFLPDFEAIGKRETPISEHLNANATLSMMSIAASFALAVTLLVKFLSQPDVSLVIYITAGFLIAIGCWNIQTAYRTFALKRRLKKSLPELSEASQRSLAEAEGTVATSAWSDIELRTRELERR